MNTSSQNLEEITVEESEPSWKPVSPRYMTLRLIQRAISSIIWVALACLPWLGNLWWDWNLSPVFCWCVLGAVLALQIILWIMVPRQVKSWKYAESPTHLLVSRGILARRLTTVPYGRMQIVEVKSGPVEGVLKLATVELQTASAGTNAVIHGLEISEAHRLREVLTARGEHQLVKM